MDLSEIRDTYLCLSFNEANIVMENILGLDKPTLLARIRELQEHAADDTLRADAASLLWKIAQLSSEDYARLTTASKRGELIFPANYLLTHGDS